MNVDLRTEGWREVAADGRVAQNHVQGWHCLKGEQSVAQVIFLSGIFSLYYILMIGDRLR